ncbi:MAG: nitrous oxide reductase accessory protein NosL [Burkholderiales bacterium]|jgi:hypothetical protein|nr:nitrous oxide reductase accessory protein NosL [Burkholderiales bacterium]
MFSYNQITTRRRFLSFLVITPWMLSCQRKISLDPKPIRWDKDVCARCGMQISDHFHSAQIINPDTGDALYFDDLGCAFLWLDENHVPWKDRAIIYLTDGQEGQWIKHTDAFFATPYVTSMAFGIAAFSQPEKISQDKTRLTQNEVLEHLIRHRDEKRRMNAPLNDTMNSTHKNTP